MILKILNEDKDTTKEYRPVNCQSILDEFTYPPFSHNNLTKIDHNYKNFFHQENTEPQGSSIKNQFLSDFNACRNRSIDSTSRSGSVNLTAEGYGMKGLPASPSPVKELGEVGDPLSQSHLSLAGTGGVDAAIFLKKAHSVVTTNNCKTSKKASKAINVQKIPIHPSTSIRNSTRTPRTSTNSLTVPPRMTSNNSTSITITRTIEKNKDLVRVKGESIGEEKSSNGDFSSPIKGREQIMDGTSKESEPGSVGQSSWNAGPPPLHWFGLGLDQSKKEIVSIIAEQSPPPLPITQQNPPNPTTSPQTTPNPRPNLTIPQINLILPVPANFA